MGGGFRFGYSTVYPKFTQPFVLRFTISLVLDLDMKQIPLVRGFLNQHASEVSDIPAVVLS
jgi:hypothetical protein